MTYYLYCAICKTEHPEAAFELTGAGWKPGEPGTAIDWNTFRCTFTGKEFSIEKIRKVTQLSLDLFVPYADRDETPPPA